MNIYALISFIFLCLVFSIKFSIEIYDKIKGIKKFANEEAEFMADLAKMQIKWMKRGRVDFYQSLGIVIQGFNLPEEEKPSTDYGKTVIKQINENE